jgi:hypothetical protein
LSTEAFTSQQGSISTIWSQPGSGGSLSLAGALSDADLAQVKAALPSDVAAID